MKSGKSINRPVLARRLELDKRRRDYKTHIQTIKETKCGIDFSHPPVVFRIQTNQKNSNIKRKERLRYENLCIEKLNEHYANKVINSKSFHDPYLIEQINSSRNRKVSPKSSQCIIPQQKSPSFQSFRSIKSAGSDPSKINQSEDESYVSPSFSARNKKLNKYNIPHYELPSNFKSVIINENENINENQIDDGNKKLNFEYNIITQNESINEEETENANINKDETFDIHPPENEQPKAPRFKSDSSSDKNSESATNI